MSPPRSDRKRSSNTRPEAGKVCDAASKGVRNSIKCVHRSVLCSINRAVKKWPWQRPAAVGFEGTD